MPTLVVALQVSLYGLEIDVVEVVCQAVELAAVQVSVLQLLMQLDVYCNPGRLFPKILGCVTLLQHLVAVSLDVNAGQSHWCAYHCKIMTQRTGN